MRTKNLDARAAASEARSDAMRRRKNCPSALPQERTQCDWARGWGRPLGVSGRGWGKSLT